MKKFKALILDLDGTTVPSKLDGMAPSVEKDGVADVINKFVL